MNLSAGFARKVSPFSFLLILISALLFWHQASRTELVIKAEPRANLKQFSSAAGKDEQALAADRKQSARAEKNLLERVGGQLKIEYSRELQAVEIIATDVWQEAEFLTAPSSAKRTDVVRNFLKQNSELVGLWDAQIDEFETTADYSNQDGNLDFVHFEQRIGGVPVFRGEVKAGLTRRGEIVCVVNNLAPGLVYENLPNDFGGSDAAIANAAQFVGDEPFAAAATTAAEKIYFPAGLTIAQFGLGSDLPVVSGYLP